MKSLFKITIVLLLLPNLIACTKSSDKKKDLTLLAAGLLYLQNQSAGNAGIGGPSATRVYGQGGSYTSLTPNKGGVSADSLNSPEGVTVDSSGNLYIADTFNNRVLYYPAGSTTATKVYGQNGVFTSNSNNLGNASASTLSAPKAILVDSNGGVYISCGSRVLYYSSGSTTASRVYGQGGSFTTETANSQGVVTANSLGGPTALALDANNGLYVSDSGNDRVLYFPSGTTTASRVYGQLGSFTNSIVDPRNVTADTLNSPKGLLLDKNNGLYIADSGNNRILYFSSGSIVPTKVYGQANFTSSSSQATSANIAGASYLVFDSNDGLFASENNRVNYFPTGTIVSTKVYGQGGSFTTSTANKGGISANSLNSTTGIALDASERLYISDRFNSRVLYY